ncbi:ABC transporter ATP-binding protein [Desulforamulus ferrireducens]|uniref:Spermidine/putrescine ABC transporter ATP-binding protein n=1 Tax=Desulforamulus ferrireducens TaxID=1833852 RepID=A0A1S6IUI1_9FIRM|nr:ABC transporter ATP-binding protein [Desulforamulus ferrireducens]AQS58423.1 spermidine/putrescine ABC transporter ATP-binding protein [Desulforamulus ferrireducens]
MSDYIVEFNNVTKEYVRQVALQNISLKLPRGKLIGLVGPNGSGKSTILKLIAGLVRPSRGSVRVNGRQANRMLASEISYLSELDVLYPFYTVAETIDFNAGLFRNFDMAKAREMMSFMQLDPGKKVKDLSKGNRGRLKIILSLARQVPLILMDEPLSGLDPLVRDSIIQSLISYLDLEQQTVIMTTHEVTEVEPILDTVVAIQNGQLRGMAEVEEIRMTHGQSLVEWMKHNLA